MNLSAEDTHQLIEGVRLFLILVGVGIMFYLVGHASRK